MENDFKWDDNKVGEACYFVGLHIRNTQDILRQIPELVKQFKESKNPILFTTHDGKPVYEGDTVYWINTTYESYWSVNPVKITKSESGDYDFYSGKYFSTEFIANEYVVKHKPKFCEQDFIEMIRSIADGARGKDTKMYLKDKLADLSRLRTGR